MSKKVIRFKKTVIIVWLVLLLLFAAIVLPIMKSLEDTFDIPGTESNVAMTMLSNNFPEVSGGSGDVIIIAPDVMDQSIEKPVLELKLQLEKNPLIEAVSNPYKGTQPDFVNANQTDLSSRNDSLNETALQTRNRLPDQGPRNDENSWEIAQDKSAVLVNIQFKDQGFDIQAENKEAVKEEIKSVFQALPNGTVYHIGGSVFSFEFPTVGIIELLGVLIALIALVILLKTIVSALLPIISAALALGFSLLALFFFTNFQSISATTPILSIMLGLAIGIDYALFIINKHRLNMNAGVECNESISAAVSSAGSAVTFAGITVIIALLGLGFTNIPFLSIMGQFGAWGIFMAVLTSLTFLPAVLACLGTKILTKKERLRYNELKSTHQLRTHFANTVSEKKSFFVTFSTKFPVVSIVIVVLLLGAFTLPALNMKLSIPDTLSYAKTNEGRITAEAVRDHFGIGYLNPIIVTGSIVESNEPVQLMKDIKEALAKLDGVERVTLATPNKDGTTGVVQVIPKGASDDDSSEKLVQEIRQMNTYFKDKYHFDSKVTGLVAVKLDISNQLTNALLPFGIVVIGLSFILLLLIFRSVWMPLIATAGFILSTGASLGVISLFNSNIMLANLIGMDRLSPVISFAPILIMAILFGLVMDYQVFLGSTILEDYETSRDPDIALNSGYTKTSKVVITAFVIMFSIFIMFVPLGNVQIKSIALGLSVGVFCDAVIVRMLFMPAAMKLLGKKVFELNRTVEKYLPIIDIEGKAVQEFLDNMGAACTPPDPQALRGRGDFRLSPLSPKNPITSQNDQALRPGPSIDARIMYIDFSEVSLRLFAKEIKRAGRFDSIKVKNLQVLNSEEQEVVNKLIAGAGINYE
jgi:RND superfamily putative drug exporter